LYTGQIERNLGIRPGTAQRVRGEFARLISPNNDSWWRIAFHPGVLSSEEAGYRSVNEAAGVERLEPVANIALDVQ